MSKHTPRPWTVYIVWSQTSGPTYRIDEDDGNEDGEQMKANAHLIAAAPDLLEACQRKLMDCRKSGDCSDAVLMPGEYCSDECAALALAIEKAEVTA